MHEVLVNRLGGLSLPRKSVVRLTDRSDMTLDVYRGCKTTMQHVCKCTCSILAPRYVISSFFYNLDINLNVEQLVMTSLIWKVTAFIWL